MCIQCPVYVMHRTHARQSTSNQSFSHNQVTPCDDRRYDAAPGYVRGSMECLPLSTLAMSYHPVVCHSPNTLARRTARAVRIRGKATSCGLSGLRTWKFLRRRRFEPRGAIFLRKAKAIWSRCEPFFKKSQRRFRARPVLEGGKDSFAKRPQRRPV